MIFSLYKWFLQKRVFVLTKQNFFSKCDKNLHLIRKKYRKTINFAAASLCVKNECRKNMCWKGSEKNWYLEILEIWSADVIWLNRKERERLRHWQRIEDKADEWNDKECLYWADDKQIMEDSYRRQTQTDRKQLIVAPPVCLHRQKRRNEDAGKKNEEEEEKEWKGKAEPSGTNAQRTALFAVCGSTVLLLCLSQFPALYFPLQASANRFSFAFFIMITSQNDKNQFSAFWWNKIDL